MRLRKFPVFLDLQTGLFGISDLQAQAYLYSVAFFSKYIVFCAISDLGWINIQANSIVNIIKELFIHKWTEHAIGLSQLCEF